MIEIKIDLHFHSDASDGTRSVETIADIITNLKLDVVALTDHDNIDNVSKLIKLLEGKDIKVIPAIELSTLHNGSNIHVLGYFKGNDYLSDEFKSILDDFRVKRIKRAQDMVKLLEKYYGIKIDLNKLNLKEGTSIGRPHMALLIHEAHKISMEEIFKKYLGNDSKAYIPSSNMTTKEGIEIIKRFNGVAILAHPGEYKKVNIESLIDELEFDGVECYYSNHSKSDTKKFVEMAKVRNLLITVGSDDHGIKDDYKHGIIGSNKFNIEDIRGFLANF